MTTNLKFAIDQEFRKAPQEAIHILSESTIDFISNRMGITRGEAYVWRRAARKYRWEQWQFEDSDERYL